MQSYIQSLREHLEPIRALFVVNDIYISVEDLLVSSKVSREGVDRYRRLVSQGIDLDPIKVFKHRKEERYAAWDGNHKANAQKERGILEIKCLVYRDPLFGILYIFTEWGLFQPPVWFTENVRMPVKKLIEIYTGKVKEFGDYFRNLLTSILVSETPNSSKYH